MSMPTWEGFMAPVLAVMADGKVRNRREINEAVAVQAALSEDDLAETLGLSDSIRAIPIIDPAVTYRVGLVIPPREPMTPLIAALVQTANEVIPTLSRSIRRPRP